jgi:uncharacterized membrane protein HdeD (DUF308 family)
VSVLVGLVAAAYPGFSVMALVVIVGVRAIVLGAFALGGALASVGRGRVYQGFTGALSILFGIVLVWRPWAGAVAFVLTMGVYAVVLGLMTVALGLHAFGVPRGVASRATAAR